MAKKVCVEAGKVAGSIVRSAADVTESVSKGTSVISQVIASTCKATGQALHEVTLKIGNLCSHLKTNSHFAYWETKQKEAFHKFGQEIFNLIVSEKPDVLEDKKVKELFEEAQNCEKEMQKIKDEMAIQRQKMEIAITLKRAEADLKSDDPRIRRVAIRVLERIGVKEAIPYLTVALNDADLEVRTRASEVMHKLVNSVKHSDQDTVETEQIKSETAPLQEKTSGASADTDSVKDPGKVSPDVSGNPQNV